MLLTGVLVLCCALAAVDGYKSGAPVEVCSDMTPQHGVPPETSRFPYRIKLSKNRIKPGESVDVTISGSGNDSFKGFFLQARVGNTPIGKFSVGKDAKTVDCPPGQQTAATHDSPSVKKSVKVTWTAPAVLKEQVIIYATVARNGGVYWVAQKSEPINVL